MIEASVLLYAHLAWTASFPGQWPGTTDVGGDDAAGGAKADNEWIRLSLDQDGGGKVVGQIRTGNRDMQVSGRCGYFYNYPNDL